jgi:hypothetical protein
MVRIQFRLTDERDSKFKELEIFTYRSTKEEIRLVADKLFLLEQLRNWGALLGKREPELAIGLENTVEMRFPLASRHNSAKIQCNRENSWVRKTRLT